MQIRTLRKEKLMTIQPWRDLGFDDVDPEDAEALARSWGYDELDESWGAVLGWAAGLLHEDD